MSIQIIGKKGGSPGAFKYKPGFDYYRFNVTKITSNPDTRFLKRGAISFGDIVGLKTGAFDYEIHCVHDAYLRNGGDFTFSCSLVETPTLRIETNGVEVELKENCPCAYVGTGDSMIFSVLSRFGGSVGDGQSFFYDLQGGSGNNGTKPWIRHNFYGVMRITAGQVAVVRESDTDSYGNITFNRLNFEGG